MRDGLASFKTALQPATMPQPNTSSMHLVLTHAVTAAPSMGGAADMAAVVLADVVAAVAFTVVVGGGVCVSVKDAQFSFKQPYTACVPAALVVSSAAALNPSKPMAPLLSLVKRGAHPPTSK